MTQQMRRTPVPEISLEEFITTQHVASCRIAEVNDGEGATYIIRSQSGAEHFFAVVDCTTQEGLHYYATGPELMDTFGRLRRVVPGFVMMGL